jgi:hypothetical protein
MSINSRLMILSNLKINDASINNRWRAKFQIIKHIINLKFVCFYILKIINFFYFKLILLIFLDLFNIIIIKIKNIF